VDVQIHIFFISALAGSEWSASHPGRLLPPGEKVPRYRLDRRFGGPLTLPGLELRPLGRPARSQTLYRLRYPGSGTVVYRVQIGSEVLTAMIVKSSIFWDITPCSPLKDNRRFRGTYRLHLQDRTSRTRFKREIRWLSEISDYVGT
jgi:hypothetical protein